MTWNSIPVLFPISFVFTPILWASVDSCVKRKDYPRGSGSVAPSFGMYIHRRLLHEFPCVSTLGGETLERPDCAIPSPQRPGRIEMLHKVEGTALRHLYQQFLFRYKETLGKSSRVCGWKEAENLKDFFLLEFSKGFRC